MRHQKKQVTLDRKAAGRRSLLANLAESLIIYEKISTTTAKAKATRSTVEKLITLAKQDTLTARRRSMKILYTKGAMRKLFEQLAPRYKERPGGYSRITAVKNRLGDGAEISVVELLK